jgi:hypothetical protein
MGSQNPVQSDQQIYILRMNRVNAKFYLVEIPAKYLAEVMNGGNKHNAYLYRSSEDLNLFDPENRRKVIKSLLSIKKLLVA